MRVKELKQRVKVAKRNKHLMSNLVHSLNGSISYDIPPDYVKLTPEKGEMVIYVFMMKSLNSKTVSRVIQGDDVVMETIKPLLSRLEVLDSPNVVEMVYFQHEMHPDYVGLLISKYPLPTFEFGLHGVN